MKWLVAFVLTMVVAIGCGGGGSETTGEAPSPAPPPTPMKAFLEGIAQTGELGGSGMNFSEELAKFKAADPKKAAQVEKDLTELIKLTEPEAIKAKAKKIADSL